MQGLIGESSSDCNNGRGLHMSFGGKRWVLFDTVSVDTGVLVEFLSGTRVLFECTDMHFEGFLLLEVLSGVKLTSWGGEVGQHFVFGTIKAG